MNRRHAFRTGLSAALLLTAETALADVTLVELDDWEVFTNGRIQTFFNYNEGDGIPVGVTDGNGNTANLWGGGVDRGNAQVELPDMPADDEAGQVQMVRLRTGFVGNVLGFGVRKQVSDDHVITGYYAITSTIETDGRRKYLPILPDTRESYAKLEGPWGSLVAGRTLTLFSRGATEITYLYGFAYGLGWPGSVSNLGPTAGHVGFGVLGNGFGGGFAYATPMLAGFQATFGIYDAANLVGTATWERTKWPRPEAELTYGLPIGSTGMFKLFANGAWQKVYQDQGNRDSTIVGAGYGGRLEVGPVHLGLAGHYGTGVGLNFALDPGSAIHDRPDRTGDLRTFDGYYAQLQIALGSVDLNAGVGVSRVHLLDTDTSDLNDDDGDPSTPAFNDDADPSLPDSTGFVPIKQQLGMSAAVVYHLFDNFHLDVDVFSANFSWYDTAPPSPNGAPEQKLLAINAGVTFDW